MSSIENILEPGKKSIEGTGEKYNLSNDYDFITEGHLPDGAVAATTKVPGLKITEIQSFEDYIKADKILVNDEGDLYSARREEIIGFVGDNQVYPELDGDLLEHVNLHENHHLLQYEDGLWGDKLDEEYNLSESMKHQLNEIDKIMDMNEHPFYQHFIDNDKATALIEGYTERVTQAMQPNGEQIGEGFYPRYTQLADHIMSDIYGTNPNQEFIKE